MRLAALRESTVSNERGTTSNTDDSTLKSSDRKIYISYIAKHLSLNLE